MKKNSTFTDSFFFLFFITVFSSLLFFLANPNEIFKNGLGFIAWFYYIPVFYIIKKSKFKFVYVYGFLYGMFSYGLYAYWLFKSYRWAFFVVIFVYGIVYGLIFLILKSCNKFFSSCSFLVQALVLCSFEYVKTLGFLGLGYGVTAYTQWKNIFVIQICDSIGVFGLNFFMISFGSTLYSIFEKYYLKKDNKLELLNSEKLESDNIKRFSSKELTEKKLSLKINFTILFLLIISISCFYIYGIFKIHNKNNSLKKIKVCSIQSNENPWENTFKDYKKNVNTQIKLTAEALEIDPEINLVVWPETAVVPAICYNYFNGEPNRKELVTDLLNYIDSAQVIFLIGNGHKVATNKSFPQVYNSVLYFDSKKAAIPPNPEVYSKNKLVPFVEFFPYQKYFPRVYKSLIKNGNQMWTPGKEINVFEYDDIVLGTPVCFEDTFSFICRKMASKGCSCFINLTNDSWAESIACQNQHCAMAVFRSVENGVPSVRCTTNGKTCLINRFGQIEEELSSFIQGYLISEVELPVNPKKTIFTKTGDIFGIFEMVITLLLLIIQIFIVKIKGNKIKSN